MATIKIVAESGSLGPSMPTRHSACLGERQWPGGGTVPVLRMFIGDCDIEVWPADSRYIDELGDKLKEIAKELRGRRDGSK